MERQMENLDRGFIAVLTQDGVYLGWRLLGKEPKDTEFHLYRNSRLIATIITSTNFLDKEGKNNNLYTVVSLDNGKEITRSKEISILKEQYLSIPLNKPNGGSTPDGVLYTYSANDISVGDLDGDGEYELILKWDPTNAHDNAHKGYTGNVILDAYKLNGTMLWRIDLGKNIRAGAHYTQFLVYDFEGDGKAELVCKIADGTKDGEGTILGHITADYRNEFGYILEGPEYLTLFEGKTGKALDTVPYDPPRGKVSDWGDDYGNRVDRFLACVAYLDGIHPSFIMCRGYYTRTVLCAYDFKNGRIEKRWLFDTKENGLKDYEGQGNHSLAVADVDGDGKDETIYGSAVIDHDGKGLYSTNIGHGDAMHIGKFDPDLDGFQVFQIHETPHEYGVECHDAKTGEIIWGKPAAHDVGRGLCADIDPRYKGEEMWADGILYDCKGNVIGKAPKSVNFAVYWDGDLLRELLDDIRIDKWDYEKGELINLLTATGCTSNNGTKATPCLSADLFGDWREEVIWKTEDSTELRIYTTTDVTPYKFYTLMHDPVYRLAVAWQNVAYNQPPHPGFYLSEGMKMNEG